PDGRKLVVVERPSQHRTEQKRDRTVLWDTGTATAKPLGEGFGIAAFSPDSQRFVLCLNDYREPYAGVVKLFDANGTELADLATAKGEAFRLKFLPDRKLLAVEQSKQL